MARDLIEAEGFTSDQSDEYVERIASLTRERLVLLVPRGDGVAFEVRSLAEFLSARAHSACEDLVDRLERMTASAHWRNTWLLTAGLIFARRPELRDAITAMLDRLDADSWTTMLVKPGALVATDSLADGFAIPAPKYEHQLVASAMRLLDGPIDPDITTLAHTLRGRMESSEFRRIAFMQVDSRLATGRSPGTRAFLAALATYESGSVAATATIKLANFDARSLPPQPPPAEPAGLNTIRESIIAQGGPETLRRLSLEDAAFLRGSIVGHSEPAWLSDARDVAALACFGRTDEVSHAVRVALREGMRRDAVGEALAGS